MTGLDLADTPANSEYFGRPGSSRAEKAAFPQARVVAIVECGSHVIMEAEIGAYSTSEVALSVPLLGNLVLGMLLLADRGFYSFHRWKQAAGTGADLLWRVKTGLRPTYMGSLPDGSWLAEIAPSNPKERSELPPVTVRVIDYSIEDGRESPETYRLLTTLLDPEEVPAQELALAYAQRWEIENAFDEFNTHQRGPRKVLRSKSPQLVLQEIWGHLCCHYVVRSLMSAVAVETGVGPDRVSFIPALNIARRSIAQGDSPPPRFFFVVPDGESALVRGHGQDLAGDVRTWQKQRRVCSSCGQLQLRHPPAQFKRRLRSGVGRCRRSVPLQSQLLQGLFLL